MLDLLLAGVVTCLGSLILGQAVLAVCGAHGWSWLAPPVGIAALILLAVPAIHVPGRAASVAVLTVLLIAAGLVLMIRRPKHRPPLSGALAALPVAVFVLVPFAAAGRAGTLGVSFDNDMAEHLLLAEAYRSGAVALVSPLLADYPLGPHALAAVLAEGLGARVDLAFAGLSAAVPVLLAWTALASVPRLRWPARVMVATVAGIPFLIAAYYGQGSFKELLEALFTLATALVLAGFQPDLGWRRWIPLALVWAGAVSVYSLQGLLWPGLLLVVWLLGRAAGGAWIAGLARVRRELRSELLSAAVGAGVLVFVLIPQIPRIEKFVSAGASNGISKSSLGNLVGPLPGWEAFGVWDSSNYLVPPVSPFNTGMWTAFVLVLVLLGAVLLIRRGLWMLPAAAGVSMLVWAYAAHTQSPYVAAKALVIATPLLLLVAALAVVQGGFGRPRWWGIAAPVLALILFVKVADSSWEALRFSRVGPTSHLDQLRALRPLIGARPTLFLGDDDFIPWELAGSRVTAAYYAGTPEVAMRPEKAFAYGQPLDFDTVTASALNQFDWVITTRDAAGSQAPAQLRLARTTSDYALWRRVGLIAGREILPEGPNAAVPLHCSSAMGRSVLRRARTAAIRPYSNGVAVPPVAPGQSVTVKLTLTVGQWDLETSYLSPLAVNVTTSTGLRTELPANLERPGSRWPIGRVTVTQPDPVAVTFHPQGRWLTPSSDVAEPMELVATPVGGEQKIPIRQACGQPVDWYAR